MQPRQHVENTTTASSIRPLSRLLPRTANNPSLRIALAHLCWLGWPCPSSPSHHGAPPAPPTTADPTAAAVMVHPDGLRRASVMLRDSPISLSTSLVPRILTGILCLLRDFRWCAGASLMSSSSTVSCLPSSLAIALSSSPSSFVYM